MRLPRLRLSILDRYIIREILPPAALGVLLFSFILLINVIPRLLTVLVGGNAGLWTVIRVFANLMPSILALTVPMAFLLGLLLAFGRMASDSELVAMQATGISVGRILFSVFVLSCLTGLLTFWIHAVALPAANQSYRELVFPLMAAKARTVVRPRSFTDELRPGQMMLYVSDIPADTGEWTNLFIHDTQDMASSSVILAKRGLLVIDQVRKLVSVELREGTRYTFSQRDPKELRLERFGSLSYPLPFAEFFPNIAIRKGDREMTPRELLRAAAQARTTGDNIGAARYDVEWHKKLAIPSACIVFGLLGLGLSLGSRKEARSAAFALSIAVIFVYYVFLRLGEQAGDNGSLSPFFSMWSANIVLGAIGIVLLVLNQREAAFDPLDPKHYLAWVPRVERRRREARPGTAAAVGTAAAGRPRVILRIPRIGVRFPSLLDRYVVRAYASHFTLILCGFMVIFVLADFLDLYDDVQQNHVPGRVILEYFTFNLPFVAQLVAPVAFLVAALVTYGILARRNEVTAMKAGGLSLYRVTFPVLLVGIIGSAGLGLAQEFLLPTTNRLKAGPFNVIKGRPPQTLSPADKRWILGRDGKFYNYDYMLTRPTEVGTAVTERGTAMEFSLNGLTVFDIDQKRWDLRERLHVARAVWNAPLWAYDLEKGFRQTSSSVEMFNTVRVPAVSPQAAQGGLIARVRARLTGGSADGQRRSSGPADSRSPDEGRPSRAATEPGGDLEPPSYFAREERPSDMMGLGELSTHIAAVAASGFDTTSLEVQLHRKVSFPMVAIVMTLIGVPFSFSVAKRGALYGVGISIIVAIVYWVCLATFEALGNSAVLPPFLAAWAPNLIFGVAGLYLMFTIDT